MRKGIKFKPYRAFCDQKSQSARLRTKLENPRDIRFV